MTRKIFVPGSSLDVDYIVRDKSRNVVVSIVHRGEVVVVFFSQNADATARAMSVEQANKFASDVHQVHQAVRDDAAIKEMEKEFDDG